MANFIERSPEELEENLIKLINRDWALIVAEDKDSGEANTMTASWGCFGELWGKPVFICYIRPQRHTYPIANNSERISLCFFNETYRRELSFCGSKSGREYDKFAECGFTLAHSETDCPYIDEARLVVLGKKLYEDDIRESCFISKEALEHYKAKDYHRFYICEIEKVLEKN